MHESDIIGRCLERLSELPRIHSEIVEPPASIQGNGGDGSMRQVGAGVIRIESVSGVASYVVQSKTRITTGMIGPLISRVRDLGDGEYRPLLATRLLSGKVLDELVQQEIECIDTAGNMFISSPAAYILIRGQKLPPSEKPTETSLFSPTSLKLIFALLHAPGLLEVTYREMANAAGISLGSVSNVMEELVKNDYLRRRRGGGYRLEDFRKLLYLWELGYPDKLRPKLQIGIFTAGKNDRFSEIRDDLIWGADEGNYLIGGELGAYLATKYLRPKRATLHVSEDYRSLLIRFRLRPDPQGEITFLRQFGTENRWNAHESEPLVDPLLIRAELLMERDDRLREAAEIICAEFIEPRGNDDSR